MSQQRAAYSLVIDTQQQQLTTTATANDLDKLYRKVSWRLMPIFCTCIILNYLDRTSLAFASIQMTQELQFSPEVLGLGGGLFFLSYCMMQVPSNLVCMHVGVARWLAGIMLCWGAVAALFAAVQHAWQFYFLRLLLGLAEAGTFPAVWYGISLWFPPTRTSVPYALVNASVAVSQMLAAPIAAALLRLDGLAGLAGWQWVFIAEGLPCALLALLLPYLLPESPANMGRSRFLTPTELQLLQQQRLNMAKTTQLAGTKPLVPARDSHVPIGPSGLEQEHQQAADSDTLDDVDTPLSLVTDHLDGAAAPQVPAAASLRQMVKLLLRIIKIWQIWFLACTEAVKGMSVMALMLWLPVMVQSLLSGDDPTQLVLSAQHSSAHHTNDSSHASSSTTGTLPVLLTAIPFTCATLLTTCLGALAQRTGRPLMYNFIPNLIGGAAFLAFPWVVHHNRVAGFAMLTVALACGYASSPHPMTALTQITAGVMAEDAIAEGAGGVGRPSNAQGTALALPAYNTVAMLGGFFGPWLLGVAVERLGGFSAGAIAMGVCMLAAGGCVLLLWCLHAPTAAAGVYTACTRVSVDLGGQGQVPGGSPAGGVNRLRVLSPGRGSSRGRAGNTGSAGWEAVPMGASKPSVARQLLHEAVAEGVSHDAEPMVRREGSSPRMRLRGTERSKQQLLL